MKHLKLIIVAVTCLFGLAAKCQKSPQQEIKEKYANLAYAEVIILCEEQVQKEEDLGFYVRYLANSYRLVNNHQKSAYWLDQMVEYDLANDEDYLYLALAEKSNGNHEEAIKWFKHYNTLEANNPLVKRHLNNPNYARTLGEVNEQIKVKNLTIVNSKSNDFGAIDYRGKLVFSSSRIEGNSRKRKYKWDGENYLDLFSFSKESREIKSFSTAMNTHFHEGPITFSADGKKAFFTRNNYLKGKKGKTSEGTINLKIYSSSLVDGTWGSPKEFTHNSEEYSVGHPTISVDGKLMVYVSNKPDGQGGTDLYMCSKGLYGWDIPVNLGDALNTESDEMFPFLHNDGTLYFSSNGHLGLGGLDVFKCSGFLEGNRIIEHVEAPINSEMDDFCFFMNKDNTAGYVSSNRKKGMGGDDIYSFSIETPDERLALTGQVVEEVTLQALTAAVVEVYSGNTLLETTFIDTQARFKTKFSAEQCPLTIRVHNGEEWSSYDADVSHCNANQEKIELGQIKLRQQERNQSQPQVNANYNQLPEQRYQVQQAVNSVSSAAPHINSNYTQQTRQNYQTISQNKESFSDPVRVSGAVTGYQSSEPIGGLLITVTDRATGQTWQTESPYNGEVNLELNRNKTYDVIAQKNGYSSTSSVINTGAEVNLNQALGNAMIPLEKDRTIVLENIFYDLASWSIRRDATTELDKLVRILKDNPSMIIELSSHTDSRGSAQKNMKLSEKRAMAAVRYILDHGISPYRISGKGFGESRLRNRCSDGAACSEAQHQENRRTEIKIISY